MAVVQKSLMDARQTTPLIERTFGRIVGWLPRTMIVLHDLGMVWICWIGLDVLRYKLVPGNFEVKLFSSKVILVLLGQGLIFWWAGLYRSLWRFASLPDLLHIIKASVLGVLVIVLGLFIADRLDMVPRSVLVLYPIVLVALLGGPRLLYRAWKDRRNAFDASHVATRALILGAGRTGEALVRGMIRDGHYHPVGFIDDDRRLLGAKVQGVPVLGMLDELACAGARDRSRPDRHRDPGRGRRTDATHRRPVRRNRSAVSHRAAPARRARRTRQSRRLERGRHRGPARSRAGRA